MPQIDIREVSFPEFVEFLFDKEVPTEDQSLAALYARGEAQKWQPWYFQAEVLFDPRSTCQHYLLLFREPKFLLTKFSKAQLEQGFWAIQSSTLDCSVKELIRDRTLPFEEREELVRSMFYLFRELFFSEPLENSVCMWWDSFCYDWHCGNNKRDRGGEDMTMQDVMFDTLAQILAIPSEICQGAALHGLSHLHHPKTGALIDRFLNQNPSLSDEWKSVAQATARFELM